MEKNITRFKMKRIHLLLLLLVVFASAEITDKQARALQRLCEEWQIRVGAGSTLPVQSIASSPDTHATKDLELLKRQNSGLC